MKKLIIACTFFIGTLASPSIFSQKYAYIDSQYILDNISEYKAANQQLDQLSISWQKDIESKYTVIDKLYKDYQYSCTKTNCCTMDFPLPSDFSLSLFN